MRTVHAALRNGAVRSHRAPQRRLLARWAMRRSTLRAVSSPWLPAHIPSERFDGVHHLLATVEEIEHKLRVLRANDILLWD